MTMVETLKELSGQIWCMSCMICVTIVIIVETIMKGLVLIARAKNKKHRVDSSHGDEEQPR